MALTSRGRLLLDCLTVQGPMIDISCGLLRQKPLRSEEFHERIHPLQQEAELLPFLLDSGLAESTRGGIRLGRSYRPDWSARLNLIRLLHGRRDSNYVFRFVWEALLERTEWAGQLINRDDVWPLLNQLQPEGATLPILNSNRMASWLRLASWVGLVQPERSNTIMLVPSHSFLSELLTATLSPCQDTPISAWVADAEAQFCRITQAPGAIHQGVASALAIFEATGQLHLSLCSDEDVFQVGPRRASHVQWRGGVV